MGTVGWFTSEQLKIVSRNFLCKQLLISFGEIAGECGTTGMFSACFCVYFIGGFIAGYGMLPITYPANIINARNMSAVEKDSQIHWLSRRERVYVAHLKSHILHFQKKGFQRLLFVSMEEPYLVHVFAGRNGAVWKLSHLSHLLERVP